MLLLLVLFLCFSAYDCAILTCLRAHLLQSSAECESNQKKAKGLTNKVMKMKEDITREVLNRVTAMADREERAVLMTAVSALKRSDSTRALKVTISAQLPLPSFTFLYFEPHLVRFLAPTISRLFSHYFFPRVAYSGA